MKENPLQLAIKSLKKKEITEDLGDNIVAYTGMLWLDDVVPIIEQMELDMMEEFKQGIDNAFKE